MKPLPAIKSSFSKQKSIITLKIKVKCIFYALNLLIAIFLALFSNCSSSKLIEKGDKYYEKKDMRKAIKFYDKALKKEPGNYYAHCSLGFSYYNLQEYAEAIYHLKLCVNSLQGNKKDCNRTDVNYYLAESLYNVSNFEEALSNYRYIIDYCQKSKFITSCYNRAGECSYKIGSTYFVSGAFSKSIEYFKSAEGFFSKQKVEFSEKQEMIFKMARAYEAINNNIEAIASYNNLITRYPAGIYLSEAKSHIALCYNKLAVLNFKNGEYSKSLHHLNNMVKYDAQLMESADNILLQANCLLKTGKYEDAIQFYQKFIERYPSHMECYSAKKETAVCYQKLAINQYSKNQFDLALKNINNIQKYDNQLASSAAVLFLQANCLTKTSKFEDALRIYRELKTAPGVSADSLLYKSGECNFLYAKALYGKKESDRALFFFQEAQVALGKSKIKDNQIASESFYHCGLLLEQKGQGMEALKQYNIIYSTYSLNQQVYLSACRRGLAIATRYELLEERIKYLSVIYNNSPSDSDAFTLASLYANKNYASQSLSYLLKLYDSPDYDYYRQRAYSNIDNFKCLAKDSRFFRWISGIRRVKVTVQEAYCNDSDASGSNDLYVVLSKPSGVLLCTGVIDEKNNPVFQNSYVVLDIYKGDRITFSLLEQDELAANDDDEYIQQSVVLSMGTSDVRKGNYWVRYNVTDYDGGIYSTNTSVPEDGWGLLEFMIGTTAALTATYEAVSGGNGSRLFNCLVQAGIGQSVDNPLAAAILAQAVDNVERKRQISLGNVAKDTALNLVTNELKANGHSDIALAIEAGSFLNCLYNK